MRLSVRTPSICRNSWWKKTFLCSKPCFRSISPSPCSKGDKITSVPDGWKRPFAWLMGCLLPPKVLSCSACSNGHRPPLMVASRILNPLRSLRFGLRCVLNEDFVHLKPVGRSLILLNRAPLAFFKRHASAFSRRMCLFSITPSFLPFSTPWKNHPKGVCSLRMTLWYLMKRTPWKRWLLATLVLAYPVGN